MLKQDKTTWLAVLAVSLGYLVDVFDIVLFGVVKTDSLASIGISTPEAIKVSGAALYNWQLAGMLVGGISLGLLADRYGRKKALYLSILLYSLANIGNAYIANYEMYAVLRFLAGLGLGGELGIGITLISENLRPKERTYAVALVSGCGLVGGVAAGALGKSLPWDQMYILGGVLGLLVLLFRNATNESLLFKSLSTKVNFKGLRGYLHKFLVLTFCASPTVYFSAVYVIQADAIAADVGVDEKVSIATIFIWYMTAFAIGDIFTTTISKVLKSRKKIMISYSFLQIAAILILTQTKTESLHVFHYKYAFLGFSISYWGVFVVFLAESFPTNIRATFTTLGSNIARFIAVPSSMAFIYLSQGYGAALSSSIVGLALVAIAICALIISTDTFENDLEANG
jgi:MFS family permease